MQSDNPIDILNKIASVLSCEIMLLDQDSHVILTTKRDFQCILPVNSMTECGNGINFIGNNAYAKINIMPIQYIVFEGVHQSDRTGMELAISWLLYVNELFKNSLEKDNSLRRIFLNSMSKDEILTLVREYGIDGDIKRCVIAVETEYEQYQEIEMLLKEAFSINQDDLVLMIDEHLHVLLMAVEEDTSIDDLEALALAIGDSLREELFQSAYIGVGCIKKDIAEIRMSYQEAICALEIGKKTRKTDHINVYEKLLFQRLMYDLPSELAKQYYVRVFNNQTKKLFNEEILQTINAYMQNNLNLSETSRKLFIHRNTLVYRIDKVQKATGLDLRKFEDAVLIKILMTLSQFYGELMPI